MSKPMTDDWTEVFFETRAGWSFTQAPPPGSGAEELVVDGVEGPAGDGLAAEAEGDVDAEEGDAADVVSRAVEGVDDPRPALELADGRVALLGEDGVVRELVGEGALDVGLDGEVDLGDEIAASLDGDRLRLAEALQRQASALGEAATGDCLGVVAALGDRQLGAARHQAAYLREGGRRGAPAR